MHVAEERLFARVHHLDRLAGVQRQHAGVDLHGQVFPGAERAADAGQGDAHLVLGQGEARRDLAPVHVQPLGRHEQVDAAVLGGDRQPGLRAEERLVLHADLVLAADHDVRARVGPAPADPQVADQVPARVHEGRARRQGLARVGHRREHLVGDGDPGRGPAGHLRVVGRHQCHRLALVPDLVPGQDRLVGVLEPVGLVSRYVIMGQHGGDPGHGQRLADVDPRDQGPGMRAAQGGPPQHPVQPQVGGVGKLPGHLLQPVGAGRALADSAPDLFR